MGPPMAHRLSGGGGGGTRHQGISCDCTVSRRGVLASAAAGSGASWHTPLVDSPHVARRVVARPLAHPVLSRGIHHDSALLRPSLQARRAAPNGVEYHHDVPERPEIDDYEALTAMEALRVMGRHDRLFTVDESISIAEGVGHMVKHRVGSLVVVDEHETVMGIVTARDVLRGLTTSAEEMTACLMRPIKAIQTPASKIVFASPDDTVETVASMLVEMRIRSVPILETETNLVHGFITMKDLWELRHTAEFKRGGKDTFAKTVMGRRGVPKGARVDASNRSELMLVGASAYKPNPRKTGDGEDAHFLRTVPVKTDTDHRNITYIGVADGVGEWIGRGVDASQFSGELMRQAAAYLDTLADHTAPDASPLGVLRHAWGATLKQEIVGSSTALVVTLDADQNQLRAASLGDSGLVIVRDLASRPIGTLTAGRHDSKGLQIVFRSQQQLHEFNYPYQLGFSPGDEARFDSPEDAQLMRVHVEAGDLVIVASDGLFDNMHEEDLLRLVGNWWIAGGAQHGDDSEARLQVLASTLVSEAREMSMDKSVDSPFAVLAKDMDILWSGGMPDDTTVVCARVMTA